MNDISRFSVIMPAFNTEAYIGEAIESVLNQSAQDWELIIVDDGSIDNTMGVIRSFKDPRIRYVKQENAGVSAARNRGVRESSGEMLVFFDSDDRLRYKALERLSAAFSAFPNACLAYGESVVMDEEGRVFGTEKGPVFSRRPSGYVLRDILKKNFLIPGATMIRTGYFHKTKGFHEDMTVSEDWEMWCRLAAIGEFIYIGKEPVLEYRLRQDSLSRVNTDEVTHGHRLECVEAVFSNEKIRKHFNKRELLNMRKKYEAAAFEKLGSENLKKHRCKQARRYFIKSLKHNPINLRGIILFMFAVSGWLPYSLKRRIK